MDEPLVTGEFRPAGALENPHVQSALASSSLRRWLGGFETPALADGAGECLIACGDGIRLQGYLTRPDGETRGLAILLHGWEGSHRSTYLLSAATRLLSAGYAVFRLNFRDHGPTHHLNPGIFHSCRLDEVVGAVAEILRRFPGPVRCLVGFSLGGNFALRVGRVAPRHGIRLDRIVAVSPVIDPGHVLKRMEEALPLYSWYFRKKWRRSLRIKQSLFPDRYDFDDCRRISGLAELTGHLVRKYGGFPTLQAYLDGYSIAGDRLSELAIPADLIASEDDPIIPIEDLRALRRAPDTRLHIVRHGGHVAFLRSLRGHSWADDRIAAVLADEPRQRL